MQFSTTPTLEGQTIVEYCGVVTGEAILGANIFRDFFAGIRDIVGGRSGAYEKELRKAREIAFETLATKAGVNPDLVYQAIRGGLAGSTVLDAKAPMVMDRNFKPGFRIDLHIKDLANALDTSHGVGAQLPLTAAVMEMMQALRADGLGTADHSALACYYEKLAKVEVTR